MAASYHSSTDSGLMDEEEYDSTGEVSPIGAGEGSLASVNVGGIDHNTRAKRRAKRVIIKGMNGTSGLTTDDLFSEADVKNNDYKINKKLLKKNSRRSRGRFGRGLTKKGGAGGKGTWGTPGSELVVEDEGVVEDPHDPNYDSDSQDCRLDVITPPMSKEDIESYVVPIIKEYFENGDTQEVVIALEEKNLGENAHLVLVSIVSIALDRKAAHREIASVLISDLYGRIMDMADIEDGFDVMLDSLPELNLDTPNAATVVGKFIARAVADDCIPPKFVQAYSVKDPENKLAKEAIEHANTLLNMKNGLTRMDKVWGVSGGMRPVKYLVRQIHTIIEEYISSADIPEVIRCLQELDVPHFHHEFVYEALVFAIEEMKDSVVESITLMLKELTSAAIITIDQLKNGFNRVVEDMPDILLDVPLAHMIFEKLVNKGSAIGYIPPELFDRLNPTSTLSRKRFVSEGDGGKIKDPEIYEK